MLPDKLKDHRVLVLSVPGSFLDGEQVFQVMGSCAANFSMSPGEKSEREYLLALSAQYQVDHYEDCYNLMG